MCNCACPQIVSNFFFGRRCFVYRAKDAHQNLGRKIGACSRGFSRCARLSIGFRRQIDIMFGDCQLSPSCIDRPFHQLLSNVSASGVP